MRLGDTEREKINQTVFSFDPNAQVYLFGSRLDDRKKGGDIDLLITSSKINLEEKLSIQVRLMDLLGEQKIDLLVAKSLDQTPFVKMIAQEAQKI